jgi:sugar lactone lactonase YvrE
MRKLIEATFVSLDGVVGSPENEIVVDGRGNVYINGGPGLIALVGPDGLARQVADGIAFPNGMAVTPDNSTSALGKVCREQARVQEQRRDSAGQTTASWQ